jgi:hypothetical protein
VLHSYEKIRQTHSLNLKKNKTFEEKKFQINFLIVGESGPRWDRKEAWDL